MATLYDVDARFMGYRRLPFHDHEKAPTVWVSLESGRVYKLVDQVAETAIYREQKPAKGACCG